MSIQETELKKLREEIDSIDNSLVELLEKRFSCAIQIAEIKDSEGVDIYDPQREAHILRQLGRKLGDNESLIEILSVFEAMLKLSKKAQLKHLEENSKKR